MDKEKLLHKYLNNEATAAEIKLLTESPEYAGYVQLADAASGFEPPTANSDRNYRAIQENKTRRLAAATRNYRSTLYKIAAILVLLIAGYLFVSNLETTVTTDIAEKKSFELPDNSIVELNANSNLHYKKRNWNENRKLRLSGEAFFKVNKGSTFEVETSQGTVQVLGTQFNVFSRDSIFSVKCFEGLVNVSFKGSEIKLSAGNTIIVRNNELVREGTTTRSAPDWLNGESSFENVVLAEVIRELEQHYKIDVLAPNQLQNKRFTGSFGHNDLKTALHSICDPLQLGFSVDGNDVRIYAK